ncbi:MAG: hypothetical protein IJ356_01135 [Erysipelotrichaceae bacterium]|nr:hypothetical protein [Erysipelotrichaceae bacterium]
MAAGVQMKMKSSESLSDIASALRSTLVGFNDYTLVCHQERMNQSVLLCFERYYRRTQSFAALTILLCDDGEYQTADVVGSGGGEGRLNISWGSNDAIVFRAVKLLEEIGFRKVLE